MCASLGAAGLTEFVRDSNAFPLKLDGFKVRGSVGPCACACACACVRACERASERARSFARLPWRRGALGTRIGDELRRGGRTGAAALLSRPAALTAGVGYLPTYRSTHCLAAQETTTERGHLWADPSPKHLSQLIRRVFADREHARAIGAHARR